MQVLIMRDTQLSTVSNSTKINLFIFLKRDLLEKFVRKDVSVRFRSNLKFVKLCHRPF